MIVNPISGGGRGLKNWNRVRNNLSGQYDFSLTERRGHAEELVVDCIAEGMRKFLLIGGDGTFHEAINALLKQPYCSSQEVTIGLLPSGTGNDWPRSLGIPSHCKKALKIWEAGNSRLVDAGLIGQGEDFRSFSYFNNIAGVGFDSYVAEKYLSKFKSVGKLSYLMAVLRGFFAYQNQEVRILIGSESFTSKILLLAIGLGKFYGAGMQICPKAELDDGEFDVTVVQDVSKLQMINLMRFLYNGKFSGKKNILERKSDRIRISSREKIYMQADGELIGHTPFELSLLRKAIRVITPEE